MEATIRDSAKRRILSTSILVLVVWAIIEGTSLLGLTILRVTRNITYRPIRADFLAPEEVAAIQRFLTGTQDYYILSPELGWTIRPHGAQENGIYRSNSQGIRADRDYATTPPPSRVRVAAFGDSYVHGDEDEVENPDTWEAILEAGDSGLEVLNFGVSGYGLDQTYLRYGIEGRRFHPHIVLIGVYAEDINRGVNVWRPFYSPYYDMPVSKPLSDAGGLLGPAAQSLGSSVRAVTHQS